MSENKPDFLVTLDLPANFPKHIIAQGAEVLARTMNQHKNDPKFLRGYLGEMRKEGWPVDATFALDSQLFELACRAFWWKFEQVCKQGMRGGGDVLH